LTAIGMLFINRQLLCQTEGPAARDDRHLVDGIRSRQQPGNQGMTGFMIGRIALLLIADHHAPPLRAHEDLVLGEFEIRHVHLLLVGPGGVEGRFINDIFDVGAGKARRPPGDDLEVHIGVYRHLAGVDGEDLFPSLHVRQGNDDLAVETSRPQQRRIQNIGSVRRRDEYHPLIGFKTVHLHEELIEGLFPLIVAAAETGAPLPAHGVYFIDKDDTGGMLFRLVEEVPDPGGPDADEHLYEIGAADGQERHIRLAGNGPGQKGLSSSRRSDQQEALGDAAPQTGKLFRIPQKFDNLLQFRLGLVDPRHVFEGHLVRFVRHEPGAAFSEGHGLPSPALHLAHEEYPDADKKQHGKPGDEYRHVPRGILGGFRGNAHIGGLELIDDRGVLGHESLEIFPIRKLAGDIVSLDGNFPYLSPFHIGDEITVNNTFLLSLGLGKKVIQQDEYQTDHKPQGDIFL